MSVAATTAMQAPAIRDRSRDRRLIRIWLYSIALLVLAMVLVGGATRLTHSGLSITEWDPIRGVIPPLTNAQWQDEFLNYQRIPEYQQLNLGMTLSEFKGIFWWEWSHRLLARIIGFVFALPLIFFWLTGRIEKTLRPQLVIIFALGALQGVVGWWMVASGLEVRTDVSQYRLATHLIVASLIFAYTVWVARGLRPERRHATYPGTGSRAYGAVLMALVFVQLYLGGLVAGLDAGLQNNDWPTMDGQAIPSGLTAMTPLWRNFFENPLTVQFDHRMLAYLVTIAIVAQALYFWRRMPASRMAWSSYRLIALVLLQVLLGILTLVNVVPISLGLLHQFTAFLLFGGVIMHRRGMSPPIPIRD